MSATEAAATKTLPSEIPLANSFTNERFVTSESIIAPAAATFVASVTSAVASIPSNFVRSALVIIAPEPALVTSLRSAAAIDMLALPSKLFPAIVLALASLVAEAAFPTKSPVRFPTNPELAVIIVPVMAAGVVAPIMAPLTDPPVIEISSLF